MEQEPFFQKIPELNFDFFWNKNKKKIEDAQNMILEKYDIFDTDEFLKREKDFSETVILGINNVLEKLEEKSQNEQSSSNIVLLFDVDKTIGIELASFNKAVFIVRPSFLLLAEYINQYNEMEIGILSRRPLSYLKKQLVDGDFNYSFTSVAKELNKNYIYSSLGELHDGSDKAFNNESLLYFPQTAQGKTMFDFGEDFTKSYELMNQTPISDYCIEKINKFSKISSEDPNSFYVLIDDVITKEIEEFNNSPRLISVKDCMAYPVVEKGLFD